MAAGAPSSPKTPATTVERSTRNDDVDENFMICIQLYYDGDGGALFVDLLGSNE